MSSIWPTPPIKLRYRLLRFDTISSWVTATSSSLQLFIHEDIEIAASCRAIEPLAMVPHTPASNSESEGSLTVVILFSYLCALTTWTFWSKSSIFFDLFDQKVHVVNAQVPGNRESPVRDPSHSESDAGVSDGVARGSITRHHAKIVMSSSMKTLLVRYVSTVSIWGHRIL